MSKIVVTGATGHIGSALVKTLREQGADVRVIVRTPADQKEMPAGVEVFTGDLADPKTLSAAFIGADKAFLLPGYPGVATEMKKAGIDYIVQSSGISAALTDSDDAISKFMIASEEETKQATDNWTILRPGAFMSNTERWIPAIKAGQPVRLTFSDKKTALLDPADIAAVAAAILLESSPSHKGKAYHLSGGEQLFPRDCIHILEEISGKKIAYEELSNSESIEELRANGTPQKYLDAFHDFYIKNLIDESVIYPAVQEILGRSPRTYRQWAVDHQNAFFG